MEFNINVISQLKTAIFAKDLSHRVIYCNEHFAEVAGEDSPSACFGKTDDNLLWKKYAEIYKAGDRKVFHGQILMNVLEPQYQVHNEVTILLNKHPLLNENGQTIGVIGSYVDVSDLRVFKKTKQSNEEINGFNLGDYFGNAVLTAREFQVLKQLLLGHSAKKIASILAISPKTIETHIVKIKRKMQCITRGDIIHQSIVSGLYHRLFENRQT
jgi:DNA-binding CsgD family transcriptional regulator